MSSPFQVQITADGSPTLWDGLEQMHSRDGAFSETNYIYGRAIELVKENTWPPRFLSLGLGLGYIEFLIAASFDHSDLEILSFEKDPFLQKEWANWLTNKDCLLQNELEQILQLTSEKYQVDTSVLKERMQTLYQNKKWIILGDALRENYSGRFSAILFDAFSRKSTPDLWEKEFLIDFINKYADKDCIFSTYAALGELKRTLRELGFELLKTKGFANKKESTFALRQQGF